MMNTEGQSNIKSQELLNKIVEMLAPVIDEKNWGFTDRDGDFRHCKQWTDTFNLGKKVGHPKEIAEKIIELIREFS
jgi:hypothetical protein